MIKLTSACQNLPSQQISILIKTKTIPFYCLKHFQNNRIQTDDAEDADVMITRAVSRVEGFENVVLSEKTLTFL